MSMNTDTDTASTGMCIHSIFPPSPLHTTVPTILIDSNMITVLELWTVGWEGEQRRECHRGPQRARVIEG